MKHLLATIYLLCCIFTCLAQENPLPECISLLDGRLVLPYGVPKATNPLHIKSATIYNHYLPNKEDSLRIDSSIVYKIYYTPRGERIDLESPFSEFKGFRNLIYDKNNNLLSKEFETFGIRGCSQSHWSVGGISKYTYEYEKNNCVKIFSSPNQYIQNWFNKENQLTATVGFYKTSDTTDFEQLGYRFIYKYNDKGKLLLEYTTNALYNPSSDSLDYLPIDMGVILYRQSPQFRDSILLKDFNVTSDSLQTEEDIPPSLLAKINDRDSLDDTYLDIYARLAAGVTTYEYNNKGLLVKRISYKDDAIDCIETFTYNDQDLLIRWEKNQDNSLDWIYWNSGQMDIYTFNYNTKKQVIEYTAESYTGNQRDYKQRETGYKELLKISESKFVKLNYDNDRKLHQATIDEKRWYYFTRDTPSVYEPITYTLHYENY